MILSEPSQEPSEEPPVAPSMPPTPVPQPPATQSQPTLDPATAALYESQPAETFQQQRLRFNRQETLSFAPFRRRHQHGQPPYPTAESTEATEAHVPPLPAPEQLDGQAFFIENLGAKSLPSGWRVDEQGYLQLEEKIADYWELTAGCLIRHHMVPRRGRMHIEHLPKDCPINPDQLGKIKITMVHQANGRSQLHTDDGTVTSPPDGTKGAWTGTTIFQLSGTARREMAMYTSTPMARTSARQVAKEQKKSNLKKFKKDNLKVELMRDFLVHMSALSSRRRKSRSSSPSSTMESGLFRRPRKLMKPVSRILLKWSKNEDGTPRAKTRTRWQGQFLHPLQRLPGCQDLWSCHLQQTFAGQHGQQTSALPSSKVVHRPASSGSSCLQKHFSCWALQMTRGCSC